MYSGCILEETREVPEWKEPAEVALLRIKTKDEDGLDDNGVGRYQDK